MGPLIPLFWTSGDVSPGFQTQGGSLTCVLCRLHAMNSSDSPLVWYLLTVWGSAWQQSFFDPHTCRHVRKHWWRFGAPTHDHLCRTQQARCCNPLAHSGSARMTRTCRYDRLTSWMREWLVNYNSGSRLVGIKQESHGLSFSWLDRYIAW